MMFLMLGQRRRRWANIKTSLFQRVVFNEYQQEAEENTLLLLLITVYQSTGVCAYDVIMLYICFEFGSS